MAKLTWDNTGERYYETGVRNCALYRRNASGVYDTGVAWNGITGITESPSGADITPLYADDIKYLNLIAAEEFGGTIEAYTYPDEFKACNGEAELAEGVTIGQQDRQSFGLSYRTTKGNDVASNAYGYILHLVYGCLASPSERAYETINESPEAITFSWEFSTTPVAVKNSKPTALITIDSTKVNAAKLANLEAILYGGESYNAVTPVGTENPVEENWYELVDDEYVLSEDTTVDNSKTYYKKTTTEARLPLPDEVATIFA